MKQAGTTKFRDQESGEDGVAIVRTDGERVALCLSLRRSGEVEVVITPAEAKQIITALNKAVGMDSK